MLPYKQLREAFSQVFKRQFLTPILFHIPSPKINTKSKPPAKGKAEFNKQQLNCNPNSESYSTSNSRGNITFTTNQEIPERVSVMQGLQEFFRHPLTWDRNNGFMNMILGLAIFGYCFCTTCDQQNPYDTSDKKK